jgi:Domain of unknown function (DUF4129)
MLRRRLVPLALVITALLAVVAIAAQSKPLGSGSGSSSGLPLSFWSFVFTTVVIVEVLLFIVAVVVIVLFRRERTETVRSPRRTLRSLALLLAGVGLLTVIARHVDLQHLFHPKGSPPRTVTSPGLPGSGAKPGAKSAPHVHFRWEELVVVLGLLLGLGVLAAATRSRLGPGGGHRRAAPEVLAAALDDSLDDLRADPDLRRAIIAAYARMETALAATGLPRRPAEAPLEYVERALLSLDTSAAAVRRLTDLFEWARFSQHEPEASMRDDAVDALVAVRDELRVSELTPA